MDMKNRRNKEQELREKKMKRNSKEGGETKKTSAVRQG